MVTESPVKMPSSLTSGYEDLELDIDDLLREHQPPPRGSVERLRELGVNRSGSAPPTVEGSLSALRSMLGTVDVGDALTGEEEARAHPAYLAYYYSTENTNPRLPPPILSREDWRATQRVQSFGGIGDQRKKGANGVGRDGGSRSLFSLQHEASAREPRQGEEVFGVTQRSMVRHDLTDWGRDGLTGLSGIGLGARKKSFVDDLQDDIVRSTTPIAPPVSRKAFDGYVDQVGMLDNQLMKPLSAFEDNDIHSSLVSPNLNRLHSIGSSIPTSVPSSRALPHIRSRTPDPNMIQRIPSPVVHPIPARGNLSPDISSGLIDDTEITAAFSCIDLSKSMYASGEDFGDAPVGSEFVEANDYLLNLPNGNNHYSQQNLSSPEIQTLKTSTLPMEVYADLLKDNGLFDHSVPKFPSNGQTKLQRNSSFAGVGTKTPYLGSGIIEGSSRTCNKSESGSLNFTGSNLMGFSTNHMPQDRLPNHFGSGNDMGSSLEGQYLNMAGAQAGSGLQTPLYAQYLQRAGSMSQAVSMLNDSSYGRNLSEVSLLDINGYNQKVYLEAILAQQKSQYGLPFVGNSIGLDRGSYVNSSYGLGLPYSASHMSSSILSTLGTANPLRQTDRLSRFPSFGRTSTGGNMGSWTSENGIKEVGFSSSFLEEFKNNKTKSYELSDIVNHVVEFSSDQYGSRFIQQKLETASIEEKNLVFPEILPHARALMTDVFGNYVIQKFFEHGTEGQRMQLASQLKGHVLHLSLQMYGCRVIQKALEVVGVDQQTQMVSELDSSVMKCVRDQNGNHVIQKCIECVPQEKIQFIISTFYGQVVALSTHPYGCRVIQRVLEHCDDAKTLRIMMEEILKSVSTLAQDQYGNYVVQHVLQHGKPEERSAIISTLAGQIVKMSQQKFASNVVEKCLTYGTTDERQLLINEMLGSTDENEPLQAMMKDQFGNYVVQKVLETCDDQNREFILSRIKVHLNALKRYTYGKHIVARVEKLVAAGERRVGTLSTCSC